MTGFAFWNPGNQFLIWGVNVLLQITLVTAVALVASRLLQRRPAVRYWVLLASLLLVLLSPVIVLVDRGLLSISLVSEPVASTPETSPAVLTRVRGSANAGLVKPAQNAASDRREFATNDLPQDSSITARFNSHAMVPTEPVASRHAATQAIPSTSRTAHRIGTALSLGMPPLLLVWFVGAIFLLGRLAVGWSDLIAILRSAKPNTNHQLAALFLQAGRALHIARWPELVVSQHIAGPVTAGLLRPRIVIPERIVDQITLDQWRVILIHELAHAIRHDPVVALLQNLANAMFWLHPLAQILNRQLAQAREEVCDNYVLASVDAPAYSRTLLTLAELVQRAHPIPGTVGLFTSRWKLEHRVAGLLDERRNLMTRLSAKGKTLVVAMSLMMAALAAFGTVRLAAGQAGARDQTADTKSILQSKNAIQEPNVVTAPAKDAQLIAVPADASAAEPRDQPDAKESARIVRVAITDAEGKPAAGAFVAAVGLNVKPKQPTDGFARPWGEILREGTADENGRLEFRLTGVSSKTHIAANLLARTETSGIAWRQLDLDVADTEVKLTLPPQQLVQLRLVDLEGQPAARIRVELQVIFVVNPDGPPREAIAFPVPELPSSPGLPSKPGQPKQPEREEIGLQGTKQTPLAWPGTLTTDDRGILSIRNVQAGHGMYLAVVASDKFAPQDLALNTGMSEERGERDMTYRSIIKNIKPGEVATIPLAPAQFFDGVVRYADTREPAPHARLTIWASQQEQYGSMTSVEGRTDAQGRFRLNPKPGIRFGIHAYPPVGAPYQVKRLDNLRWKPGAASQAIEIELARGVLARGTIVESQTNTPIPGASVQYIPDQVHNKFVTDDIVTGWQSIQKSDAQGRFQITVFPGPGTLLVHGTPGKFIFKQIGSRQMDSGKPGGVRNYAHAIQPVDPQPGAEFAELTIKLDPGQTIAGKLTNEAGDAIEHALVVSQLNILDISPTWRGFSADAQNGRFELGGLANGEKYLVHFLDPKQRLGATATLSAGDQVPTIVLRKCGDAKGRFVDPAGKPLAGIHVGLHLVMTPGKSRYDHQAILNGELLADEDFSSNIDQLNNRPGGETNSRGELTFPALIPGARYRFINMIDGAPKIEQEFIAESGKSFDLGEIVIRLNK